MSERKDSVKKRMLALLLVVAMVMMSFVACSSAKEEKKEDKKEEKSPIVDMFGREITIDEPISRVVVLTAADCEILYAIGAGDTIVGRGSYCDYPEEVLSIPEVQSGSETNIEQILALNPQVVINGGMDQTAEQVAQLEAAGITVVETYAQDIAGTYEEIQLIGRVMGKESEAGQICDGMRSDFLTIAGEAEGNALDKKPTVYFEVSPLEWGLWAAGSGTFMNEICDMLGCENIFADVNGWAEVSEEQVLERNPDYIVTISMYYGEGPTPVEEILGRPGWENISAVKNKAILNLTGNELSRPSPRLVDGMQKLYDLIFERNEDSFEESEREMLNVYSMDQITDGDDVFIIECSKEVTDGSVDVNYVLDENAVFADDCDMEFFEGYQEGDTPYSWFRRVYDALMSAGDGECEYNPMALMGLYDVDQTVGHIEYIHGLYWWD